jgi:Tol biopolymer transport system component
VSFSPDGGSIVFAVRNADETRDLWTARADGSEAAALTKDPEREESPRWSPDGRWILFLAGDRTRKLRVVRPDGSGARDLALHGLDVDGRFCWSPEGDRIAFFAVPAGQRRNGLETPARLYTVGLDGGAPRPVTKEAARRYNPTWSRKGAIAFDAHAEGAWESDDGLWEIWSMDSRGGEPRRLTSNRVNDWGPAYSPDGSRIAWCRGENDKYEIWLMDADGGGAQRVTRLVYDGPAPGEPGGTSAREASASPTPPPR